MVALLTWSVPEVGQPPPGAGVWIGVASAVVKVYVPFKQPHWDISGDQLIVTLPFNHSSVAQREVETTLSDRFARAIVRDREPPPDGAMEKPKLPLPVCVSVVSPRTGLFAIKVHASLTWLKLKA